jgi:hypothetical protein
MRPHTTLLSAEWLRENDYSDHSRVRTAQRTNVRAGRTAWAAAELADCAHLELDFRDARAPAAALEHLNEYGLVFVKHVPASADATERFVRHFAWPRETLWGTHWSTSHDPAAGKDGTGPSDSAYSSLKKPNTHT